jgi:hypothetical protein
MACPIDHAAMFVCDAALQSLGKPERTAAHARSARTAQ